MSVRGTPVTTYDDGFPKAHPSLPPSTPRSGRGVEQRRTLVELTDDHGRTQAGRRKVGGTHSLQVAHESLATRVVDPTVSTAERAGGVGGGGGGWGLGKRVVVRRDRRPGNRQAGGGPDSPIGFPKAPPAPPARWIGGDWVATVSNWDTTERTEGASSKVGQCL